MIKTENYKHYFKEGGESERSGSDSNPKNNSSNNYLYIEGRLNDESLQKNLDFFVQAVSGGIPEQYIINPDYRFVRVAKHTKKPFEKGWNLEKNLLTIKQVKKDMDTGCNHDFGQAMGYGQVMYVDADTNDQELREKAISAFQNKFPTIKIRTRSGKNHLVYEIDKPIYRQFKKWTGEYDEEGKAKWKMQFEILGEKGDGKAKDQFVTAIGDSAYSIAENNPIRKIKAKELTAFLETDETWKEIVQQHRQLEALNDKVVLEKQVEVLKEKLPKVSEQVADNADGLKSYDQFKNDINLSLSEYHIANLLDMLGLEKAGKDYECVDSACKPSEGSKNSEYSLKVYQDGFPHATCFRCEIKLNVWQLAERLGYSGNDLNKFLAELCGVEIDNYEILGLNQEISNDNEKEQDRSIIKVMTIKEMKEQIFCNLPPRKYYVYPILPEAGYVLVVGEPGVGKSFYLMALLSKMSEGLSIKPYDNFLPNGWVDEYGKYNNPVHPTPVKCMFIDGEMSIYDWQERNADLNLSDNLIVFTRELLKNGNGQMINLGINKDRENLLKLICDLDVKVVAFDNLASLCVGLDENSSKDYGPVNNFFLELRNRGITVIVVHHTGNNGMQRGTSARRGNIDGEIYFKPSRKSESDNDCDFVISVKKYRIKKCHSHLLADKKVSFVDGRWVSGDEQDDNLSLIHI